MALLLLLPGLAAAQDAPDAGPKDTAAQPAAESAGGESDAAARAQANNPLANFTAVNFQDYYIGELSDSNEDANQAWLRVAQPFSIGPTNWITRASLPLNSYPIPPSNDWQTGLGDLNVLLAYLFDVGNPAVSFGFGPQFTFPTATKSALGSEKWSAGFANVLFNASSPRFQYGYLLTWQHSFAGKSDRATVNTGAFQPFLFYQLGHGVYLRSSAICTYNFQNGTYNFPLGLGAGYVIKTEGVVYNMFVEPQVAVLDYGPNQPQWQIFTGFNMQFDF